jgi:hypothetical protein
MSGGGLGSSTSGQAGEGSDAVSSALRNYPIVPNSAGGAQASAAPAPQAQSLNQLQTILSRLGQGGPNGQPSAAMRTGNLGQQLMQQGQQPQMRPPMPAPRPTGAPAPMQGAMPPQMGGGMGMGGQMTPQMMNMMLAQRNGLMG